jgi:3-hydroxyisobutyrate dehydrogenase-like beta-hydroxyacid dehydrogenase
MTAQTIGIISAGDMGSAIGLVLTHAGVDVVTSLTGRSDLTRRRAERSGIRDLGSVDAVVATADMLLSVLVPAEAASLAAGVAESMQRTGARPVFVDCNAIAPQTVRGLAAQINAAGATFVDVGMMGGPPKPGGQSPRIYCSGPETGLFLSLRQYGLDVRLVGPEIGQASGLKMLHSATTKGTRALWIELLVAARAMGLSEALAEEFAAGGIQVKPELIDNIPHEPRRAHRMIGELEETALTFQGLGLTPKMLEGAADMHRFICTTALADQTSQEPDPPLDMILDTLADHARGAVARG